MHPVTCACGCGQPTTAAKRNRREWGHVKGQPVPYVRGHNGRIPAKPGYRWCSACGEELPDSSFHKSTAKRRTTCRACHNARRVYLPPTTPRIVDPVVNRARVVRWRRENPDKRRRLAVADAARRRGAPLDALARGYVDVIATDPCVYCGGLAATVDHIVPVASGGTSEWSNLSPACGKCNSAKGSRSLLLYLATRP